ncbi:MAG: bifunctional riboflavin kinase/FAD synthetase [Gammaproteobacteria bacterium]
MKLIRSLESGDLPRGGCALSIGNFDAVHLGHRALLRQLTRRARERGLPAVVMTFDPPPQEYFRPEAAPPRLTTIATRFFELRECGADIMLSVKFNRELAQTGAEEFIRECIAAKLHAKYLLIGGDFRFGARRAGDFGLLASMAAEHAYEVEPFDMVAHERQRISSTRVRELLGAGDMQGAARLLGRNYAHAGRVMHGRRRGREWGYPTINLAIRHRAALAGVFAVRVTGLCGHALAGVASLGRRPSVRAAKGAPAVLLEVHLFDYDADAYGKRVCVEFIQKIRAEEKFDDYAKLIRRIGEDARIAKEMLRAET